MEHKLNDELSFNVQQLLNNILLHVTLSFNTKQHKYVLLDNFNVLVLLKLIHNPIFNNMVQHFWMHNHSSNKHVLLVSLKIL
jgi:hypothetical protein